MSNPLPYDWFFLIIRLAFVALLYSFIWQVLKITLRDLKQAARAPVKRKAVKLKLVVTDPAESVLTSGTVFPMTNRMTIGRHPDCTISIEEPFLSATHAEFQSKNGAWYLTDLDSTNGTFINGRQLSGTAYIEQDDVVQFGRLKLQLVA